VVVAVVSDLLINRLSKPTNILTSFCCKIAVSLSEISVDSVSPLYGPMSGGTRVTITGQYLTMSSVTAAYIGQDRIKLRTHDNRLLSFT